MYFEVNTRVYNVHLLPYLHKYNKYIQPTYLCRNYRNGTASRTHMHALKVIIK